MQISSGTPSDSRRFHACFRLLRFLRSLRMTDSLIHSKVRAHCSSCIHISPRSNNCIRLRALMETAARFNTLTSQLAMLLLFAVRARFRQRSVTSETEGPNRLKELFSGVFIFVWAAERASTVSTTVFGRSIGDKEEEPHNTFSERLELSCSALRRPWLFASCLFVIHLSTAGLTDMPHVATNLLEFLGFLGPFWEFTKDN